MVDSKRLLRCHLYAIYLGACCLVAPSLGAGDGLGRAYPKPSGPNCGRFRWPYHYDEAVVPQRAGYGFFPTMWRDWHENTCLIFSEPEHHKSNMPKRQRRRRNEELPEPAADEGTSPDDEFAPPPPDDVEAPPSEIPELPNDDVQLPGNEPAAATPEGAAAPEGAAPPAANPPSLPDLPNTLPTTNEESPPAEPGAAPPAAPGPTTTPGSPMGAGASRGPAIMPPARVRTASPRPKEITAKQRAEDKTLRALATAFRPGSVVRQASANLHRTPAPNGKSTPARWKSDSHVTRAAANLPRQSSAHQHRATRATHADFQDRGKSVVDHAIAYEDEPNRMSAVPMMPIFSQPTGSPKANPFRDSSSASAPGSSKNPLR